MRLPELLATVQEQVAGQAQSAEPEKFDAGRTIIEHVSNSSLDDPIIQLPTIFGIDFSITKHVLMLWLVAAIVFVSVMWAVRRYLRQERLVPSGFMNALEAIVEFMRDSVVAPNVGRKWTDTWTPLVVTFFLFTLTANAIGLLPIFELLGLLDRFVLHTSPDSLLNRMLHGGPTITGNFNVTAGLATVTFFAIIIAGTKAHGFFAHWKNLVPHGMAWPLYILLIPIEILSMLVKPFALTMRLAANMTGGHIAILSILSFVFIFAELFRSSLAGMGVGFVLSLPLAVGIEALEIIVILVQAYVFTLLTAVFIGLAINVQH
jgi:F-type H+-transporting ATPase subunit a